MPDFIRDAFPNSHADIVDARLVDSFVEEACADFECLSRTLAAARLGDQKMSAGLLADIEASLADLRAEIERRIAISMRTNTDLRPDNKDNSEAS